MTYDLDEPKRGFCLKSRQLVGRPVRHEVPFDNRGLARGEKQASDQQHQRIARPAVLEEPFPVSRPEVIPESFLDVVFGDQRKLQMCRKRLRDRRLAASGCARDDDQARQQGQ